MQIKKMRANYKKKNDAKKNVAGNKTFSVAFSCPNRKL